MTLSWDLFYDPKDDTDTYDDIDFTWWPFYITAAWQTEEDDPAYVLDYTSTEELFDTADTLARIFGNAAHHGKAIPQAARDFYDVAISGALAEEISLPRDVQHALSDIVTAARIEGQQHDRSDDCFVCTGRHKLWPDGAPDTNWHAGSYIER